MAEVRLRPFVSPEPVNDQIAFGNFQRFQAALPAVAVSAIAQIVRDVRTELDQMLKTDTMDPTINNKITALYQKAASSFKSLFTATALMPLIMQWINATYVPSNVADATTALCARYTTMAMSGVGIEQLASVRTAADVGFELNVRAGGSRSKLALVFTGLEPVLPPASQFTDYAMFLVPDIDSIGTVVKPIRKLVQAYLVADGTSVRFVVNYTTGQQSSVLVRTGTGLDTNASLPSSIMVPVADMDTSVFLPQIYSGRITVCEPDGSLLPFAANIDASTLKAAIVAPTVLDNPQKLDFFEFTAVTQIGNPAVGPGFGFDITAVDAFQFNLGFSISGGTVVPVGVEPTDAALLVTGSNTSKYVSKAIVAKYLQKPELQGQIPWAKCATVSTAGALVAPAHALPIGLFDTYAPSGKLWKTAFSDYMRQNMFPIIQYDNVWYRPRTVSVVAATAAISSNTGVPVGTDVQVYDYGPMGQFVVPFNNYIALNGGTNVATGKNAWYGNIANTTFGAAFAKFVACMIEANVVPPMPTTAERTQLDVLFGPAGTTAVSSGTAPLVNNYGLSTQYFNDNIPQYYTEYPDDDPRAEFNFIDEYSKALLSFGNSFYTYTYGDQLGLANFLFYGAASGPAAAAQAPGNAGNIQNYVLMSGPDGTTCGGAVIEVYGEPQPKPVQPKPEPKPAPRPEPKPAPRPEPKPAPRPEPKPAPRPEPKPAPVPPPKPAPRPDPLPPPTPSPRPVPVPDPPRPVPRPVPKPAPRPEPKPAPRPEPKPAPRPEPRPVVPSRYRPPPADPPDYSFLYYMGGMIGLVVLVLVVGAIFIRSRHR